MDFYLPYVRKNASDAQAVRFGRTSGVFIILIAIIFAGMMIAHSDKPVFLYLLSAYGLFTPGIATMFLMGILWKRTTHAGAMTAGVLTIPLSLAMEILFPKMPFFNRTGIVFWICLAACAAVSLMTKPKPAAELEGLIWNKESLSLRPEERDQQRGLRNPFFWWAIITSVVLFFYIRYA